MTTPYVTGTVSVTAGSAVVTGTGTGWQTSGPVAGQFGVDGLSVPVLSIDSNTKITLAQPWPGATASGKAYWISYDTANGQQTVGLMQKIVEYIARLDKAFFSALSGLIPAADKIPYFGAGGAGALADFNAAARALLAGGVLPNAQFPERLRALSKVFSGVALNSLALESGLIGADNTVTGTPYADFWLIETKLWGSNSYAVQYAYSITGGQAVFRRNLAEGNWNGWKAVGSTIVGTVSQTNGLQSGAIIERGANANGQYTRYADGTMKCTVDLYLTYVTASDLAAVWTFPVRFSVPPNVQVTETEVWPSSVVRNYRMGKRIGSKFFDVTYIVAFNDLNSNQPGDTYVVNVAAEGRWY